LSDSDALNKKHFLFVAECSGVLKSAAIADDAAGDYRRWQLYDAPQLDAL